MVPIDVPVGEIVDLRLNTYLPDDYNGNDENNDNDNINQDDNPFPITNTKSSTEYSGWFSNVGDFISKKLFW